MGSKTIGIVRCLNEETLFPPSNGSPTWRRKSPIATGQARQAPANCLKGNASREKSRRFRRSWLPAVRRQLDVTENLSCSVNTPLNARKCPEVATRWQRPQEFLVLLGSPANLVGNLASRGPCG